MAYDDRFVSIRLSPRNRPEEEYVCQFLDEQDRQGVKLRHLLPALIDAYEVQGGMKRDRDEVLLALEAKVERLTYLIEQMMDNGWTMPVQPVYYEDEEPEDSDSLVDDIFGSLTYTED